MRACLCVLIAVITAACEPQIEELPASRARRRDTSGWTSAAPSNAAPKPCGAPKKSCIRPSPPEPTRTLLRDGGADPSCPPDPEVRPKLRSGRVVFVEAKSAAVKVEIAEKEPHRMRGLMYRTEMPEDHGMIFRFDESVVHRFWMHNTCIPLDMLFIEEDGTIVGIEENVPTLNDATYECGCPSKYVLELNAGWARRHGVVAGQRVRLEGI